MQSRDFQTGALGTTAMMSLTTERRFGDMMNTRALTPEELLGPLNEVERKYAPPKLYIAGRLDVISAGPRVALIGSRKASGAGLATTSSLARALVRNDVTVVSGLAEGIDTAAHETAIQADGRTIAVLGTPLDDVFPARNRELQDRIIREHLAITQFPIGTRTQPKHFVLRNRTMALVSHASVIVEASDSSGSLHQGWEMIRLGRPLFIHRAVLDAPGLTWPRKMLDYGAVPLAKVEEVLEVLPASGVSLDVDAR